MIVRVEAALPVMGSGPRCRRATRGRSQPNQGQTVPRSPGLSTTCRRRSAQSRRPQPLQSALSEEPRGGEKARVRPIAVVSGRATRRARLQLRGKLPTLHTPFTESITQEHGASSFTAQRKRGGWYAEMPEALLFCCGCGGAPLHYRHLRQPLEPAGGRGWSARPRLSSACRQVVARAGGHGCRRPGR